MKTGLTVAGKRHVFQGVRNRPRRSEDRFESHEVQRVRTLRRCPPPQTGHFLYRCVGDRGTRINDTMPEEISQWPIAAHCATQNTTHAVQIPEQSTPISRDSSVHGPASQSQLERKSSNTYRRLRRGSTERVVDQNSLRLTSLPSFTG